MAHDDFRERITACIEELEALASSAESSTKPVQLDQACVGRLSRMDALQSQAMSRETQRRRRIEITWLEAALGRSADGEFGECVHCGEPIAPKRLDLDPGCTTCIECARSQERG